MLGLATHEPNFSLLREEIKFTQTERKGRQNRPEEITFHLLHLSVMRDYIHHEFAPLREKMKEWTDQGKSLEFTYDLERVIDDWVMMGFLVGNDFVPHLPNMHIKQEMFKYDDIYRGGSSMRQNGSKLAITSLKWNICFFFK